MDLKMDPQKIDRRRFLKRVTGGPGGMCGSPLALDFEDSGDQFGTPVPLRGRRIYSLTRIPPGLGNDGTMWRVKVFSASVVYKRKGMLRKVVCGVKTVP